MTVIQLLPTVQRNSDNSVNGTGGTCPVDRFHFHSFRARGLGVSLTISENCKRNSLAKKALGCSERLMNKSVCYIRNVQ